MTHICVSKLGHHWFRYWFVAWTAPSHYQNQCWNIVNWTLINKLQWNFNRYSSIFIQENACENVVCENAAILSRPQCVNTTRWVSSWHLSIKYIIHIHVITTNHIVISLPFLHYLHCLPCPPSKISDSQSWLSNFNSSRDVPSYHQKLLVLILGVFHIHRWIQHMLFFGIFCDRNEIMALHHWCRDIISFLSQNILSHFQNNVYCISIIMETASANLQK